MIAKGHDFPDVTLVGVVNADIGLSLPSYRSSERVFELITQAVGRSGRSDKKGEAIIQTYSPTHYAITMAARQDYELFYRKEMEIRKLQFYPPYSYIASITVASKNEELTIDTVYRIIDRLADELKQEAVILGPTTPYVPYENNKHIRSIMVKYRHGEIVKPALEKLLKSSLNKSGISLTVNIDPYNL